MLGDGDYTLQRGTENPGIGGTEHMGLQVAGILSCLPNYEVTIGLSGGKFVRLGGGSSVTVKPFEEINSLKAFDSWIVPVWQAPKALSRFGGPIKSCRIVLWSHHPHDRTLSTLCKRSWADCVVSVGGYQFYSNDTHGIDHHWIPNPFPYWAKRNHVPPFHERPQVAGHVGALVRPKGFHRIVRSWSTLHESFPELRLQVIGSGDLYGPLADPDPELPMSKRYAREVRNGAKGLAAFQSIEFMGRVNTKVKILDGWKFAIQNLTGGSEAMPASVQELIVHGIPVVASSGFGMWDFMNYFPETTVSVPSDLVRIVRSLEQSRFLGDELVERCSLVSAHWEAFDKQCLEDAWDSVLARRSNGPSRSPESPPLPPLSAALMRTVRYRKHLEALRAHAHRLFIPLLWAKRRLKGLL